MPTDTPRHIVLHPIIQDDANLRHLQNRRRLNTLRFDVSGNFADPFLYARIVVRQFTSWSKYVSQVDGLYAYAKALEQFLAVTGCIEGVGPRANCSQPRALQASHDATLTRDLS